MYISKKNWFFGKTYVKFAVGNVKNDYLKYKIPAEDEWIAIAESCSLLK